MEFFKRLDITNSICACYMLLGAVTYMEGDYQMSRFYYKNSLEIGRKLGHKGLLSYSFDGFAALAAKQAAPEFAARLAGAAETLRESIGFVTEKEERRFGEAYLAELKTKLDEADFSEFYGQGRKMQLEEILPLIESRS